MGDMNIDIEDSNAIGYQDLREFMCTFDLTNLIKEKTCITWGHESTLDLILSNKPCPHINSSTFELGVSDFHKMSVTILKSEVARLKPIKILYRSYKNFRDEYFLSYLNQNFERDFFQLDQISFVSNKIYNLFVEIVTSTLDKHAPITSKTIWGNQPSLMNKELNKAIMHRSRLQSKYRKLPTPNNRLDYQKQRNKCVAIRRKAVNEQFSIVSSGGKVSNKDFYKLVKPYLTNKGAVTNNDTTLVNDDKIVTDQNKIVKILNDCYVNIVQITTDVVPSNIKNDIGSHLSNEELVAKNVDQYKDHPSIKSMKENCKIDCTFSFQEVSSDDVFRHLNN